MSRIHTLLVTAIAALALGVTPAAGADTGNVSSIEETIRGLIDLIRANYVLPENVDAVEEKLLEGLESGEYQSYGDLVEMSKRVTMDLREASGDLHFGIRPKPAPVTTQAPSTSERGSKNLTARTENPAPPASGIGRVETLADAIGYIELQAFVDPAIGGPAADAALAKLGASSAIVLDLRTSRGGHPGMVAYLLSYFFDGEPFLFNRLEWPNSGKTIEFHTVADLPSPRFTGKPVYILTSRHTPSAAEGFCYHMKHLERATIVGEPTAGAAHLNQGFELPGFQIMIPTGRPLSPVTGSNWEGVGVIPHHQVAPVRALEVALALAAADGPAQAVE